MQLSWKARKFTAFGATMEPVLASYQVADSGSETVTFCCPCCKAGTTSNEGPTMKMCSRWDMPSAFGNSYQIGLRIGVPDRLACRNCVYMYGSIL